MDNSSLPPEVDSFNSTIGNVLVVIAVLTSRALKPPQNLFLVSLASADILVATLIMPFSLANELMGYCLDRYWSVTQAVEYNLKRTPRRVKGMIVVVWLISAVISFPPLISMDRKDQNVNVKPQCELNDHTWYILYSSIGSFFAPCVIMILVYIRIYQVAKTRTRSMSEKRHDPDGGAEAPRLENGLSQDDLSRENGHCASPPPGQPKRGEEDPDMDLDDSSSSDEKAKRPHHEPISSRRDRRASRKNSSSSKHSSRKSRASSKSLDLFSSRRKRRNTMSRKKISQAREKRFTFVLAVVMGVFVVCWFPFFFSYSLYGICRKPCEIPRLLFKFFFWIGYCNSSLNPVIYTIFNQDFRRAFQKILCKSWKRYQHWPPVRAVSELVYL
ncbi:hypothetical protein NFI96_010075 [Prochilodus magdalenae]|nr:hypothetical protein NFI96_010075 [Prochilodus magdalenae]